MSLKTDFYRLKLAFMLDYMGASMIFCIIGLIFLDSILTFALPYFYFFMASWDSLAGEAGGGALNL